MTKKVVLPRATNGIIDTILLLKTEILRFLLNVNVTSTKIFNQIRNHTNFIPKAFEYSKAYLLSHMLKIYSLSFLRLFFKRKLSKLHAEKYEKIKKK